MRTRVRHLDPNFWQWVTATTVKTPLSNLLDILLNLYAVHQFNRYAIELESGA